MKFPNNLREIRKKTNTKAKDLSDLLGITFQHYYSLERGEKQLYATQIRKLSKFLNVTVGELLGEETGTEYFINNCKREPLDFETLLIYHELTYRDFLLDENDKDNIRLALEIIYQRAIKSNRPHYSMREKETTGI